MSVNAGQPLVRTVGGDISAEEFAAAWGVNPTASRNSYETDGEVSVMLRNCSIPANILWPGDSAEFTFQFRNLTDKPLKAKGKLYVIQYETYTKPGDNFFKIGIRKIKDVGSISVSVDMQPEGWQDITIRPEIPESFGGYALIIELEGHDRLFGASCVRTFKPEYINRRFSKLTVDMWDIDALVRLGLTPNRMELGYTPTTDANYEKKYQEFAERLQKLHSIGRTTTVEFGAGARDHQPLGEYRKWLDENDVMLKGQADHAWLPAMDADFSKFVKRLLSEYGWPKGPINGVMLWNEPWEGVSISGWGADMLRYREIYASMADSVKEAEKEAGVKVFIGGCDSSSNTLDKLFSDGSDKYLKWLDFMSIHYQGISPYTNIRMFNERVDENGKSAPVEVWDTESWMANSDDRIGGVLAAMFSFGQKRVVGVNSNQMVNSGTTVRIQGTKDIINVRQSWSAAASLGAFRHFIGERNFRELLFRTSAPFIMIFDGYEQDGRADIEDSTIVVLGDMGTVFRFKSVLFRSCRSQAEVNDKEQLRRKLAALPEDSVDRKSIKTELAEYQPWRSATLTLDAPDDSFSLYDFYGNRLPNKNDKIIVPLDARGFYLRGNGIKGSYAKLITALKNGRIDGVEPLVSVAHDMLSPVDKGAAIRLTLTNALNRPVTGNFSVEAEGLELDCPKNLSFSKGEIKEVIVKVTGGKANPDNQYPLRMVFDAGEDGLAVHEETMRVNYIENRAVTVDGKLDDWKGILPQAVNIEGEQSATMMQKAWLPFMDFDESAASGLGIGYVVCDKDYFYFAAKVSDSSEHPGTIRFASRDDDSFFYPEVSYKIDPENTFSTVTGRIPQNVSDLLPVKGPNTQERIMPQGFKGLANYAAFEIKVDKPAILTISYIQWKGNFQIRRKDQHILMLNPLTDAEILRVKDAGGEYGFNLRFVVNGHVRLNFPANWDRGIITGLYLDTISGNDYQDMDSPGAIWLDSGNECNINWPESYGKTAVIFADGTHYGESQRITLVEDVKKTALNWPEGVRRYSYRRNPELPTGNSPRFDNVQIAFNVLPENEKWLLPCPPGTMPKYTNYACTDYEYALNKVADEYGGGTEVWRLRYPGMPHKHFYPREPRSSFDGAVKDAKLAITHEGNTRITECAIPWSEIPWVKKKYDAGEPIKFSFKVNNDSGPSMELSEDRSVAKENNGFLADFIRSWANELEFGFSHSK